LANSSSAILGFTHYLNRAIGIQEHLDTSAYDQVIIHN
jgi:hypothetical protein